MAFLSNEHSYFSGAVEEWSDTTIAIKKSRVWAKQKGVASMRQDEAIASSCFRRRQIFAHLFHDKAKVNFN